MIIICSGIKSFKRQLTKEERLEAGVSFDTETFDDIDDGEDVNKIRDDLGKLNFVIDTKLI